MANHRQSLGEDEGCRGIESRAIDLDGLYNEQLENLH